MNLTVPKTIMVIDDEQDILFTLKCFLESEGFNVFAAGNGLEAMNQLDKCESLPDLILLDMKMPIMNGWEFAEAFYKKYDHGSPILVITAAGDAEQRARDIHAADWLEKPFTLDGLLIRINRAIKPS